MMANNPKITVEVQANGVEDSKNKINSFKTDLNKLVDVASTMSLRLQQLTEQSKKTSVAMSQIKRDAGGVTTVFNQLAQAVVAYVSIDIGRQIISQADDLRRLEQRLTMVTKNHEEYNASLKQVLQTSNAFGITLATSSAIYQRTAIELTRMGKGNKEINEFYKTMVALGTVGSSSVQSMNASLIQLTQSLSGRVQADEFRSISEQAPMIAIALKEYLKVSSGELKKMFEDGKVMSDDLYKAIMTKGKEAQKIYENLPISVENAWVRLQNTFGLAFLQLDKTLGISQSIILAFNGVSQTIQWMQTHWDSIKRVVAGTTAVVATFASTLAFSGVVTGLATAFNTLTVALGTTRLGIIAMQVAINPLYGILTALATGAIVAFTNNMINGFDATRRAVKNSTGGMISDLDILGAKMAGLMAGFKALTTFKMPKVVTPQIPSIPGFGGILPSQPQKKQPDIMQSFMSHVGNASKLAEQQAMQTAGKRQEQAQAMLQSMARPKVEKFSPSATGGKTKSKSGKSDEAKAIDSYADSLKGLKQQASDASVALAGMRSSLAMVQAGDIKGYEAKQKQIEAYEKINSLLGDYRGKNKAELEQLARTTVAREQETDAIRKQVEWFEKLNEAKTASKLQASQQSRLEDAFKRGGILGLEKEQRGISLEDRQRELLGGVTSPTKQQEEQAKALALQEQETARRKEFLEQQVNEAKQAQEAIGSALRSGWDNFTQYMLDGTMTFKEMMVGLLRSVAAQLLKVYMLQMLTGIVAPRMTGGSQAGAMAGVFSTVGNAMGVKARAGGGSVSANVPYVVGESGRELFVPQSAGNIVPNHRMSDAQATGGGFSVVNNITVHTDGSGGDEEAKNLGKQLSAMIEIKMNDFMKKAMRQGGMLQRGYA